VASQGSVSVQFVGDCAAKRARAAEIFMGVQDALRDCHLLVGQLETVITERGSQAPHAALAMRTSPEFAAVLRDAGFEAMSFAGNHCLDWGREGFSDTLAHAAAAGLTLFGAGENLAEARRPAIVERQGVRFAWLGYSSILPLGYWADNRRPGCAPLRAFTAYEQIEHDQPGTPARILSWPHSGDLADMVEDIVAARDRADVVLVSIHWGLHMVEAEIADYQRDIARAAVSAGASAILGHHPHILKGVEFIDGVPVFYSLGNFAIEQPQAFDPSIVESASFRHLMSLNLNAQPDELYVLPPDTRMTGIARLEFDGSQLVRTYFRPAWIGDDSVPRTLVCDDPQFGRTADYLKRISACQGLSLRLREENDMLLLTDGNTDQA